MTIWKCERWGATANTDEASLTGLPLTSYCTAQFLTGHGPELVHDPGDHCNRVSTLTWGSQVNHAVIFHIDGPVLIANPKNLNQVSRSGFWFILWWKNKIKWDFMCPHVGSHPRLRAPLLPAPRALPGHRVPGDPLPGRQQHRGVPRAESTEAEGGDFSREVKRRQRKIRVWSGHPMDSARYRNKEGTF